MARRAARAVPASRMLSQVQTKLKTGWPAGLTLLTGDDLFHLDRAHQALVAYLAPDDASGFGLTVFGQDKIDVATVVAAARSAGMFSERRVVVVRDLASLDGEPDTLIEFAATPPSDSYLLVRAPALDMRRKLHKALVKRGEVLEFARAGETDPRRLASDVEALARERGLKLDRAALEFLGAACAGDLYRVDGELAKLSAWAGEGARKLGLDDVREVATGGGLLSGWELGDAVLARQRSTALEKARRLVEGGDEPIRIVAGALAYRLRSLLQAGALRDGGCSEEQSIQATRSYGYRDSLRAGLRSYRLEELLRFPSLLLDADRSLKSRGLDSRAVLESLVEALTESKIAEKP